MDFQAHFEADRRKKDKRSDKALEERFNKIEEELARTRRELSKPSESEKREEHLRKNGKGGPCVDCGKMISYEALECTGCGKPDAGRKVKEKVEEDRRKEEEENARTEAEAERVRVEKEENARIEAERILVEEENQLSESLVSLINALIADGSLTNHELDRLFDWLETNPKAFNIWPGTELHGQLHECYVDGEISADELKRIASLLQEIRSKYIIEQRISKGLKNNSSYRLDLSDTEITYGGLKEALARCSDLKDLNLFNTPNITHKQISELQMAFPSCFIRSNKKK